MSGGQKQRMSLARAVYSKAEIYLLDDPLSQLDANVANHVFNQVLDRNTGILRNKTVILVTHSLHFTPTMDQIVIMNNGNITQSGTYDELKDHLPTHSIQNLDSETQKLTEDNNFINESTESETLIAQESVETSSVSKKSYLYYLKSFGSATVCLSATFLILSQIFAVWTNLRLAKWATDKNASRPEVRNAYLEQYGTLAAISCLTLLFGTLFIAFGGLRASLILHKGLLSSILCTVMSFFDTTPKGRIVNRFSSDMNDVDSRLPDNFLLLTTNFLQVLGTIFIICYTNLYFLIVMVLIIAVYFIIQQFYIKSSRQLKRITSTKLSPIYSHFSEAVSGASVIRAFRKESFYIEQNQGLIDDFTNSFLYSSFCNRWITVCLELLGNIIVLSAGLFAVMERESLDPGIVGLSLSCALQISSVLNSLIRQACTLETLMVSVERIQEYIDTLQHEFEIEEIFEEHNRLWPSLGRIEFKNFELAYREDVSSVLKDLNFVIESGEKIGIVGRTGAGKSSLIQGLFRIMDPRNGSIEIDGIDIRRVSIKKLRSSMTIISQDPLLFAGNLRSNLDPFNSYSDDEIFRSLNLVHFQSTLDFSNSGLDYEIAENGSNLSIGQKQLICLARALIRKTKILILDEATSALDYHTDNLIQETISQSFENCTVITIAHRLQTVMKSDKILVLEAGRIVEFDEPEILLNRDESLFKQMSMAAGLT